MCQHHWQIETAHGPQSRGECTKCGAVKMFWNDISYLGPRNYLNRQMIDRRNMARRKIAQEIAIAQDRKVLAFV